ncbi:MAG: ThuA domain-containing protein [Mariniphaga sp.]|nr:ThuA domain-containing protein [Mariniphaga sp.]
MRLILTTVVASLFIFTLKAQPVKIMLVTGGHSYDTIQFFQLFDALDGIEYTHFQQPEANQAIAGGVAEDFEVLVFYDMWREISEAEKSAYMELTKKGKPMLFLHHALVSYQNWPQFEKLLGGKYIEKRRGIPEKELSTYEHDVWVYIQLVGNHPVTKGFSSLRFFDEVYGNYRVSEDVVPILTTNHPQSEKIIGWENRFNKSRIIYLQPGHDYRTFETEEYRRLLLQAINYLAKSN